MAAQIVAGDRINRVFPWLKNLSSDQVAEFYTDFFDALERALQEKDWLVLEDTIENWQATAEVLADPELTTLLTEPVSEDELEVWDHVETELFDTTS